MDWPAYQIERRPLAALVPYARNARTHSDGQIGQIAASIREWGWTMPVLIDEAGTIIAGHGRVLAAARLGIDQVPVLIARGWSEAQKRAYVIADNKLTDNAGWDEALLRLEVGDLASMGFDLPLMGFSEQEITAFSMDGNPGLMDPDEVPELPAEPITRRGDVWQLGRHRMICGDATNPDDVVMAIADRTINVAFTSPPYAEQREYDRSSGFELVAPNDYVRWFKPAAANVARHIAADGSWFINIKPSVDGTDTSLYVFDLVIAHVREWGWHFATEFCWERNGVPKSVTQRFKNQFEPIYQFTRGRWKMRPDKVRHESYNVPRAGGPGSGQTSWANAQETTYGVSHSFGAVKKRRNGTSRLMSDVQGYSRAPGEFIGPGFAYPGNRLPTFCSTHSALGHAAAFPVGLPNFFCRAFADEGDIIFDPFCGTGSTLIAAELASCIGIGCELSPAYVDVTIERWQNFTGEKAKRES
jgi:DNA modification methylase